jgi:hypothetical protein
MIVQSGPLQPCGIFNQSLAPTSADELDAIRSGIALAHMLFERDLVSDNWTMRSYSAIFSASVMLVF